MTTPACGLEPTQIELLATDFAPLDTLQPGLAQRALDYVLGRAADGALLDLAGVKGGGAALKLACCCRPHDVAREVARKRFFDTVLSRDPTLFLRLAKVYEAVSRQETRHLRCRLLGNGLEWLEIVLREATQLSLNTWPSHCSAPAVAIDVFEAMLTADGKAPDLLVRSAFAADHNRYGFGNIADMFTCLAGFAESVLRYPHVALEALADTDIDRKVCALELLAKTHVACAAFAEPLVALGVSSSKRVREATEPLLFGCRDAAAALVKDRVCSGTADERGLAISLLWKLQGEACREFLTARLTEETAPRVLQIGRELLASMQASEQPEDFALPPIPDVPLLAPLGEDTCAAFRICVEAYCQDAQARYADWSARARHAPTAPAPLPVDDATIARAFQQLQTLTVTEADGAEPLLKRDHWHDGRGKPPLKLLERPELKLIHAVRFCLLLHGVPQATGRGQAQWWGYDSLLVHYRRHHRPGFCLRELAAVFRAVGLDERLIGWDLLECWHRSPLWFEADAVWPYFAERLGLLEEVFGLQPSTREVVFYLEASRRQRAFDLLSLLPRLPAQFLPPIWELALGSGKAERAMAQKCLNTVPGKEVKIAAALENGQQDVRAVAAEWLGRLGTENAIPAILAALRKEKSDVAKGAMMLALESLGVSVDQFLDRTGLAKDAARLLAKGVPPALQWFPFATLPPVHWSDTGERVPQEVVTGLILQAHRLKNPEPGPVLRRYCSCFVPAEKEALGQYVLESWIAQDTLPKYTREEAAPLAEQQARQMAGFYPALNHEQLCEACLRGLLAQCSGSAINDKGVLAVAGACGSGRTAPAVGRYIKQWYGIRVAQSRALIQMLAWVEHPAAVQLLLSIGHRFRTKSIRDEAEKHVQLLAERKGWSRDELADRTIPTAGFDENGKMEFDYGDRVITATLQPDFSVVLTNPKGQALRALPDAKDDADDKAKDAKRVLSAAKKELKGVLQLQKERLYEAMCTQRAWPAADWAQYLNGHPIVKHHVQRLVWVAYQGDTPRCTFRPIEDGTLTDLNDEAVQLATGTVVRLAHDCNTDEASGKAWIQHCADYQIQPLFQQFGKGTYTLQDASRQETEIRDFEGHMVEAFKLRGRATKLGYTRGQTEDGGWFYTYRKSFPTLGFDAVIEFSGNPLPEENRMVALKCLRFEPAKGGQDIPCGNRGIVLAEIPAVVLTECWSDMRTAAADGKGFDPAWEKKVEN